MEPNVIVAGLNLNKETLLKLVTKGGELIGYGLDANSGNTEPFVVKVVCGGSDSNKLYVKTVDSSDKNKVFEDSDYKFGLNVNGIGIDNDKTPRENMIDDGVFMSSLHDIIGNCVAQYLGESTFKAYRAVPCEGELMIVSILSPDRFSLEPFDVANAGSYYESDLGKRNDGLKVCDCGCGRKINYDMPVSVSLSFPYDVHNRYTLNFVEDGIDFDGTGNEYVDTVLSHISSTIITAANFRTKYSEFFEQRAKPDLSKLIDQPMLSLEDLGIDLDNIGKPKSDLAATKPKKPKGTVH